jgi:hypothetical protein
MTNDKQYEIMTKLEIIREEVVNLLIEAKQLIDRTDQRDFAHAYVWGNLFAEEFGYLGKSGGDYLDEVIERLRHQVEDGEEE